MKNRQANHVSFYILIVLTLLVSAIYIVIALKQNGSNPWNPAFSAKNGEGAAGEGDSYMQNIREHRDQYSVTSIPLADKLTFTLHIAPDSANAGEVLYEDSYGIISVGDITLDKDNWKIYFDFIGKGNKQTFTLLSLDIDDEYPICVDGAAQLSYSSGGIANAEPLTEEDLSDDWRVKISYPYQGVTAWHKEYWNSQDLLPNGERIGYNIFFSINEQEIAETSGEMDVTFTMKGLKRLIWQSKTAGNTQTSF